MDVTAARAPEKAHLSMPFGQPVELLVSGRRRDATYAVPAVYEGDAIPGTDEPPRRLTEAERARVQAAATMLADAIAGQPVDELRLNDAIELLHRISERVAYRAALDDRR